MTDSRENPLHRISDVYLNISKRLHRAKLDEILAHDTRNKRLIVNIAINIRYMVTYRYDTVMHSNESLSLFVCIQKRCLYKEEILFKVSEARIRHIRLKTVKNAVVPY